MKTAAALPAAGAGQTPALRTRVRSSVLVTVAAAVTAAGTAAVTAAGTVPAGAAAARVPVLAYACDTAGTYDLYVAALDGSGARRVTEGVRNDTSPAWSPDGRRLVFWSSLAGRSELTVVDADGQGRRVLPVDTAQDELHRLFAPAWSPDGQWIAFESNRQSERGTDLYLVRPDGTALRRVTRGTALTAAPDWAPDGRSLLLSRQFGPDAGTTFPELFLRDPRGGETQLTRDTAHDWEGTYGPDGRTIAFSSTRGGDGRTFRIHLRHPSGRTRRLSPGPDGSHAGSPAWAGRSVVYAYDPDGSLPPSVGAFGGTDVRVYPPGPLPSQLRVVGVDGAGDRALTSGSSSCTTPAVRPAPQG